MRVYVSTPSGDDFSGEVSETADLDAWFVLVCDETGDPISVKGWLCQIERMEPATLH